MLNRIYPKEPSAKGHGRYYTEHLVLEEYKPRVEKKITRLPKREDTFVETNQLYKECSYV